MTVAINSIAAGTTGQAVSLISQSDLQMGIAPNGTITAGGALTLLTALDIIYGPTNNNIPGVWLYFPVGAFAASPAGFYWCVMTSTTVGTVYTGAYVPGVPVSKGTSTTPITGLGSAYTQTTAITLYGPVVLVPANTMGPNGSLRITATQSNNNSAGGKSFGTFMSAAAAMTSPDTLQSLAVTTTTTGRFQNSISNGGATNGQIWMQPAVTAYGTAGTPTQVSAIDTTQPVYIGVGMALATATDWIICQQLLIEALPGF